MAIFTVDAARVERYRLASEGAHAASLRATDEALAAGEHLTWLRMEVRRQQDMASTRAERTEVRPDMAERIARAEADVARLRKAQAQAGERQQHACRIWDGVEAITGQRPLRSLMERLQDGPAPQLGRRNT